MKPTHQFRSQKYNKKPKLAFLPGEKLEDWSRDRVISAILKLNSEFPLNTLKSMRINRSPIPDPILSRFSERATSRKFLHFAGCYFLGSWNSALRECNIDPIIPAYNKFWSKTVIVESIKSLKQAGHLTVFSIWRDRSKKTTKTLLQVTGKATTGAGLHDAARRYFGSWDKALERSGVNPEAIKERPFWTKKKVVRSIKKLHIKGIALNTSKIGTDSSRTTAWMIEQELGKRRVGRSLYGAAYRIFGSWDRALYEAGVNPVIHRRRPFSWNIRQLARILNILHQMEIPVNRSSLGTDTSEQTASIIFDLTGQRTTGTYIYRLCSQRLGSWDSVLKYSGFG